MIRMKIEEQIETYIASLAEPKRSDLQQLHQMITALRPEAKLWFLDGKNEDGRIVSNPNIGYGSYTIKYANGTTREFYQVGLSANKTGVSVYIMGLEDKKYLADTFGDDLGKASVTGYCIRFKALSDISTETLIAAIRHGFNGQC